MLIDETRERPFHFGRVGREGGGKAIHVDVGAEGVGRRDEGEDIQLKRTMLADPDVDLPRHCLCEACALCQQVPVLEQQTLALLVRLAPLRGERSVSIVQLAPDSLSELLRERGSDLGGMDGGADEEQILLAASGEDKRGGLIAELLNEAVVARAVLAAKIVDDEADLRPGRRERLH